VEQSAGNIYGELMSNLNHPERMTTYCRQLVECNPYINGCAICFKPNYYPGRELFMTYVHNGRAVANGVPRLITTDHFGTKPYTECLWYSVPMNTGRPCWTDPLPEEEDEGVTMSFCLPIVDVNRERVGVLVVDVPVERLSQYVLTDNSTSGKYSVILGSDGSLIVHPDQKKNFSTVMQLENNSDPTIRRIVDSMLAGETGSDSFHRNGQKWYVFYKPFLQTKMPSRSMEKLSWSIGVIYSEDVIFNFYNRLILYVLGISVVALILFYLLCRLVIRRQLRPLNQLTEITKSIADGHYDETMPTIKLNDEIGMLYEHFQLMEQSLAEHVKDLGQLTRRLKNRREVIHEVYAKEQSVDRVMSSFLRYVTNQMIAPAEDIERCVDKLCKNYHQFSRDEIGHVVDTIQTKSDAIIGLIHNMLNIADNEAAHD
jgi:methyl-accepting chemotaxis protein/sigma-B regulation protein RsbU (phosphoserine phosphatase)